MFSLFKKSKKRFYHDVAPDEIFLDSHNLPNFNLQQMEGRIEKPISKNTITMLGIVFLFISGFFSIRIIYLQLIKGGEYLAKSEKNSFESIPIFADRGIIFDRNHKELAWNERNNIDDLFANRMYTPTPGFAHVLGYVAYPQSDDSGNFWQDKFIGKDGVEKIYNKKLQGVNGAKLYEQDAKGNLQGFGFVNQPVVGNDLVLSIDSRVQEGMYQAINDLAKASNYHGGAGVIMDVTNGEIIALTSFPEYDPNIISLGTDQERIRNYIKDSRRVFINRVLSGVYTPGSIVKPFMAIGALNERLIDPMKKILSTGQLVIPNIYNPGNDSIFKDWRAHGYVDMRQALSVSSNVYFYEIGGGFQNQKGLGISNIEKYARMFGIGQKTGIDLPNERDGTIPSINWKKKYFPNDPWRIGDTYHTVIGQYGFQVTPLQMVRAIGAIANRGTLVTPHLLKDDKSFNNKIIKNTSITDQSSYDVVQEGMRLVVTEGTGKAVNSPFVNVAAKSGTAQVGIDKAYVNSWVEGFFPYEQPRYAFVILMESGKANQVTAAASAMKYTLEWIQLHAPEYFK